jgi:hypothetical protein
MLSDAAIAALRDMEHHISLATHFIAGFDYDAFRDDTRTVFAVTRCLETRQASDIQDATCSRQKLTAATRRSRVGVWN